ncbi:hypothetical protein FFLO_06728 [Filobasidium floriforme]|uniref:Uncharacterized protein n=1 Tax=Filobasidium floriforme TaxID=5210 RepID=A0A8K0NKB1_9TREE|nr:uncharacterized protein HD553DRAFT_309777 [Filobasidium floriforme]KAG7527648.1 hypothetical protein FFLO_06728 [Filobasidium floriforme]KAH8086507.1 hypothetical protein HD553DRAFT_309777 [Filobasidium floriforme]
MQLVDFMSPPPPPPELANSDVPTMAVRAMQGLQWHIARKIARWLNPASGGFNMRGRFWQSWRVLPENGGGMLVVEKDLGRLQYDRHERGDDDDDDDDDDDNIDWYIDLGDIHHVSVQSLLADVPPCLALIIYRAEPTTGKMTEVGMFRLDTPHIAECHRDLKTWLPDVRFGKSIPVAPSEHDLFDILDDFATIDDDDDNNNEATTGARDQNPAFGTRLDEQARIGTEMSIDSPSLAQQQSKRKHKRGKLVHDSDAEDD